MTYDERDELKRRIDAAHRRQLGLPVEPAAVPPTPEELAEREYCEEIVEKRIKHELDASKFFQLPKA